MSLITTATDTGVARIVLSPIDEHVMVVHPPRTKRK